MSELVKLMNYVILSMYMCNVLWQIVTPHACARGK